jgi:hypothetical protein
MMSPLGSELPDAIAQEHWASPSPIHRHNRREQPDALIEIPWVRHNRSWWMGK